MTQRFIGVDVGGTKVSVAVLEGNELSEPTLQPTVLDSSEGLVDQLTAVIQNAGPADAVGIGVPSVVDFATGTARHSVNVPLQDVPLRRLLTERLSMPVFVDNDATVAALAEAHDDNLHQAAQSLVLFTIGTGVGGGIVLNGELFRGHFGIGAEFGHYRVVPDGRPCGCGQHGCLEQYASGSALTRFVKERAKNDPERAQIVLSLGDGTPDGIQGAHITEAARKGDSIALEAFAEIGHWLGQSMADLASILDPEVFVVAGGVSDAGEILTAPTRESYHKALAGTGDRPFAEVVTATLGPDAGLIGAADLARHR
jgi:glucokinase